MVHLYKSPGCWPAAGLGARWVIRDRPGGSVPAAMWQSTRSTSSLGSPGDPQLQELGGVRGGGRASDLMSAFRLQQLRSVVYLNETEDREGNVFAVLGKGVCFHGSFRMPLE